MVTTEDIEKSKPSINKEKLFSFVADEVETGKIDDHRWDEAACRYSNGEYTSKMAAYLELRAKDIWNSHKRALNASFELQVPDDVFPDHVNKILQRFGGWFEALQSEKIPAFTTSQKHFVAVFTDKLKTETEHEQIWVKYRNEIYFQKLMASESGLGSYISYGELRQRITSLANAGHKKARQWLIKEGHWSVETAKNSGVSSWERLATFGSGGKFFSN